MNALLKLSGLIDALTERIGKGLIWLVLVMTLISAGNAEGGGAMMTVLLPSCHERKRS